MTNVVILNKGKKIIYNSVFYTKCFFKINISNLDILSQDSDFEMNGNCQIS